MLMYLEFDVSLTFRRELPELPEGFRLSWKPDSLGTMSRRELCPIFYASIADGRIYDSVIPGERLSTVKEAGRASNDFLAFITKGHLYCLTGSSVRLEAAEEPDSLHSPTRLNSVCQPSARSSFLRRTSFSDSLFLAN